ncbi:hypothetical protein ABS858_23650 [Vibrio neptunius]|uniref:hypothetical protein n=1 Tax=Vibrio neptunius TaxID=170651 RepID=UPI003314BA53
MLDNDVPKKEDTLFEIGAGMSCRYIKMIKTSKYQRSDKYIVSAFLLTLWLTLGGVTFFYGFYNEWTFEKMRIVMLIFSIGTIGTLSLIVDFTKIFGFKVVFLFFILTGFLGKFSGVFILICQYLLLAYMWKKCRV